MIKEYAVVVALVGEDQMQVEVQPQSGCGSCQGKSACGIQLFGTVFGGRKRQLQFPNRIGARVGDTIILAIDEKQVLGSSLTLYLLPLLGLLFGAGLFGQFTQSLGLPSDFLHLLGALVGFSLTLFLLRLRQQHLSAEHIEVHPVHPNTGKMENLPLRSIL